MTTYRLRNLKELWQPMDIQKTRLKLFEGDVIVQIGKGSFTNYWFGDKN